MAEHRNSSNRAVRRIMREVKEFASDDNPTYAAGPLEDDLFEWHFTIRGPRDSEFEGGIYHGRIILPTDYPMKPPDIVMLTPNGRFKVGEKICLTISGHHPEHWQPAWSIRTALLAIISFLPTPANGALGAIEQPEAVRRELAKKSHTWSCTRCGSNNATALPEEEKDDIAPGAEDSGPQEGDEESAAGEEENDGLRRRTVVPREDDDSAGAVPNTLSEARGQQQPLQQQPLPPLQQQLNAAAAQPPMAQAGRRWMPQGMGAAVGVGVANHMAPGAPPPWRVPGMAPGAMAGAMAGAAPAAAAYQGVGGPALLQQQQAMLLMQQQQQQMQQQQMQQMQQPQGMRGPMRRRRVVRAQVRIPLGSFDLLISILVVFIAAILLRKFYFVPSML